MTTIIEATASLVDIEVETLRTDAVQTFVKQETVFVDLRTEGEADDNAVDAYAEVNHELTAFHPLEHRDTDDRWRRKQYDVHDVRSGNQFPNQK